MDATESLRGAWRSERLIYRAVDEDLDKPFLKEHIVGDPVQSGLSSYSLLVPPTKKYVTAYADFFLNECLLGVIICLPATAQPVEAEPSTAEGAATEPKPKSEPTPIGFVCLFRRGHETYPHQRAASLGVSIIEAYRGHGYGGEAVNWALDWGFRRAGLHRVALGCFAINPRAERLYRKLGFVEEGREREFLFYDRGWHDLIRFSMLDREWEALRGWKTLRGTVPE